MTLPTPGTLRTGKGCRKSSTREGLITNRPSGLFQSEAILARNLLGATPAEAVRPVSSRIWRRMICATSVAEARPSLLHVTSR
ncbi:Uncharacterised protein [Bordetella pertussis]|nr:Uncharacterised protein [Bordetella pertussis]